MTISPTNSKVKSTFKPEVNDLTVSQELRTLQYVKSQMIDARFALGPNTRFTEIAKGLEELILSASREIIAADDYLNERC